MRFLKKRFELLLESKYSIHPDLYNMLRLKLEDDEKLVKELEKIKALSNTEISDDATRMRANSTYGLELNLDSKLIKIRHIESGKEKTYDMKIGRVLSLITDLPDHLKSEISNRWNAELNLDSDDFVITNDFAHYYDCTSKGTLGSSCMSGKNDDERFEFYEKNPNIELLILNDPDDEDEILGRAVLIHDEKLGTVMNRVYYGDEKDEIKFRLYAKEKGYKYIDDLDKEEVVFDIKYANFDKYPYIDNFHYLNRNTFQLATEEYYEKNWKGNSDRVDQLTDNDYGFWSPIQNSEEPTETELSDHISDWSDVQYYTSNQNIVAGIKDSFIEQHIEGEIEYRSEQDGFDAYYDSDDYFSFLEQEKNISTDEDLIKRAIKHYGYDWKSEAFDYYEDEIEDNLEELKELFDENFNLVIDTIDDIEKLDGHIVIETLIDNGIMDIDSIKEHIFDNLDYDDRHEMVEDDLNSKYENSDADDIFSEQYGSNYELDDIAHALNYYWDKEKFIDNLSDWEKTEILDSFLGRD